MLHKDFLFRKLGSMVGFSRARPSVAVVLSTTKKPRYVESSGAWAVRSGGLLFLENETVGVLSGNRLSVPPEQTQAVWWQDVETTALTICIKHDPGFITVKGESAAAGHDRLSGSQFLCKQFIGRITVKREIQLNAGAVCARQYRAVRSCPAGKRGNDRGGMLRAWDD